MEYYTVGYTNLNGTMCFRAFNSKQIITCDREHAKELLETVKFPVSSKEYKLYRIKLEEVE